MPQGFAQDLADFFIAIEEHVLLAGEVVEDGHSSDVGGCRDLVHCHMIEASPGEETGGDIGDSLPGGEPPAGSAIGRH